MNYSRTLLACFAMLIITIWPAFSSTTPDPDWHAKWIGLDKAFDWDVENSHSRLSARYFRKEFTSIKNVKSAKIFIVGLGLYELYVNGEKISDQVLSPTPTDYTKTVKYNVLDITNNIVLGKNALGVILGTGHFYNNRQNTKPEKHKNFGYPKMLFQLEIEYTDGTVQAIMSDDTWRVTSDGPIRSTNDYDGEIYDATKELNGWNKIGYKSDKWLKPDLVAAPQGKISAQINPNMKIMQTLVPISITQIAQDTFILDMGQNMTGWLELKAQGKRGQKITLRFAEILDANGRLKTENLRSAMQTDIYTMKGSGTEIWEPHFVTHGFRYVEITGFPTKPILDDFRGKVVYDEMEMTGTFESSNPLLDQIVKNAHWGICGNYKGIPLDCPQRDERQPWLGDHTIGCFGESFLFNNEKLYIKWLDDIRDSQTEEGQISDICPPYYMTYYTDNMTWPGTYLFVAQMIYQQFGNPEPIREHYPTMKKWLSYMKEKYMTADYIVTKDKYGDWCVPPESKELIHSNDPARKTDGQLIATAYYYKFLQLMQQFASIAGHQEDIREFATLAENIKKNFNQTFYSPATRQYSNGTVTANLLPLAFDMVENKEQDYVFQNIINRILSDRLHISTGVIGTQWLMRELTKRGRVDVAYTIATQKTYPSWGYMVEQGATTIWELWNGDTANPKMNSHNHVMLLGDLITWVFEDLAGIKTHKNYPGFKWLWMKPNPTETLTFVKASHKTPAGWVTSEWQLKDDIFTWKITIPEGSQANILIPALTLNDIQENGRPAIQASGVKYVRIEENCINLEIAPGNYTFTCPYGKAQDRWKEGIITDEFINKNASYPESHAATLAENKYGQIVAAWFGGTKERNPDVCIWVSRLVDGKWTQAQNVANGIINDTLRYACWNPVLYQVADGELQLYYKVGPNVAGWKGKVITSGDGGKTWSLPRDLPEGFLGPIKNKPILLKNGSLLSPSSTEDNGWKVHFEISNDLGKTWQKIGPINDGITMHAIQPTILTHRDGRLQILCRTQERVLGESFSSDNGKTWSPLTKSSMPNNNSGMDAVTLRDGSYLLVYNHVLPNESLDKGKGARTPLNIAVSDDGKIWYAAAVLEDSPIDQYSYPSVIQSSDGKVHIVYTWRRKAIKHVVVDPQHLILSEIKNMQWPSQKETAEVQIVNNHRYKVSVCDWMMLKRQKIGAIELAKDLNADGLELDLGGLGQNVSFQNSLTDKKTRDLFISECNRLGIQFSSLALSAFYGQSFAKRDNYEQLIDECIATMQNMGIKVAFLPMGNQSDVVKEPELFPIVFERLKVVAKKAEAAGVIFGIETTLPAKEEAKLIDKINSPAIKSYVNFSAILKRDGNIIHELKTLGKNRIIQIHASNTDGFWIENDPALNMMEIKAALDKMGWSGWLVIERSRDINDVHNVKKNYGANVAYLKSVFQQSDTEKMNEICAIPYTGINLEYDPMVLDNIKNKAGVKKEIVLVTDVNASPEIVFGTERLKTVLEAENYQVVIATTPPNNTEKFIIQVSQIVGNALPKEGYTITSEKNRLWIQGNDASGALYGCIDLAKKTASEQKLPENLNYSDYPKMKLRGTCIGMQKPYYLPGHSVYEYPYTPEIFPWFYDKTLWIEYLNMLVENKMNSLYLWNGHPFASLVKLKDYPFAVEVDDETFNKNEEMFSFLTTEAQKRGIWIIQMFYNIIVSKPFADHYGIRTQDRSRPIIPLISDYTRKSIAAFIEKYPNVGLLVCLGEAIDTYEDDVKWFTETILPGVKDGLKALGKTEEPPVVLRAHDTNCQMVMKAALPIYKNLYTMYKYNGESLTTYQPSGPWGEIHKKLSRLGTVHICNVHILANLEPFRYGSPDFIQKCVQAMHNILGANALHLYPQASYWDWPYTADKADPRLKEMERDWIWYEAWARYAWDDKRDRNEEIRYWSDKLGDLYGCGKEGRQILEAYEQAGEISPKLLRKFGITDGNRQTFLLGMFMSQLVNPTKWTIYPDFYLSCGPVGEVLQEYMRKEWAKEPHVGELPTQLIAEAVVHGKAAVEAIKKAAPEVTKNKDEFNRLKNDMYCYQAFATYFSEKVKAAIEVLQYVHTNDIHFLENAIPLMEKSLDYYRELVRLTKDSYLYANSMQTGQRRIPFSGDDAKYKTWEELLPLYEEELANFQKNVNFLKKYDTIGTLQLELLQPADVKVIGDSIILYAFAKGEKIFSDEKYVIDEFSEELKHLKSIRFQLSEQLKNGTTITFEAKKPVQLLIGYFNSERREFAKAPTLEIDAGANQYGQAEVKIANAIEIPQRGSVNIHSYTFPAGKNTLNLGKGGLLALGFIDANQEIKPHNAGIGGTDIGSKADWLFY